MNDLERIWIEDLRKLEPRLKRYADEYVYSAYREWSGLFYAAGWISPTKESTAAFWEWASKTPLDRKD